MRIEPLEPRIAPAILTGNVLTYTDADGDAVTVKITTKGPVSEALFQFDSAFATAGPQTLQKIALLTDPKFDGASIVVSVKQGTGMADGRADIGVIDANVDLGTVTIPGDLGRIVAGDADATKAIGKLSVRTLGLRGAATQAAPVSEVSSFTGSVGSVTVADSIFGASLNFLGGLTTKLGSLKVGGSLFGEAANSGNILVTGSAGSIAILGNLQGGNVTLTAQVKVNGDLGQFTLGSKTGGGNIYGGTAGLSGWMQVMGSLKKATLYGGIFGGTSALNGFFSVVGDLGTLKVGGGIFGGDSASDYSGAVSVGGNLNSATIVGNINGGNGRYSGYLNVIGFAKSVTVGVAGKVLSGVYGDDGQESGVLFAGDGFGKVTIAGDLVAGAGPLSGAIDSNDKIGSVRILGDVIGTAAKPVNITAWHEAAAKDKKNVTIGSLQIDGDATGLLVRAGYNDNDGVDADAQIGSVKIKGNFIDSSIVASALDQLNDGFGNADDVALAGGMAISNQAAIVSSIGSVTIGGIAGTTAGNTRAFGIVAELIGSVKVGKQKALLTKGANLDALTLLSGPVGSELHLFVREVGPVV